MRAGNLMVVAAIAALCVSAARADEATLGVFFDADGTASELSAPAFTPVDVYIVATGFDSMASWEASVVLPESGWVVLESTLHPASAVDHGEPGNYVVDLGTCLVGGSPFVLASYRMMKVDYNSMEQSMCVRAALPADPDADVPGYAACDGTELPFALAPVQDSPAGCAVLDRRIICPGLWGTWVDFALGSASIGLGETLEIGSRWISYVVEDPCGPYYPPQIGRLRARLTWDPAILRLEAVTPVGRLEGWDLVTEVGDGSASLELVTGGYPVSPATIATEWLRLSFSAVSRGVSPVAFSELMYALPGAYEESVDPVEGTVVVGGLAAPTTSFGSLKSRF